MQWIKIEDKKPNDGDIVPVMSGDLLCYGMWAKNTFVFNMPISIFHYTFIGNLPNAQDEIQVQFWAKITKHEMD